MAEDLGGLFDSDPGFLEELASGSRRNTEAAGMMNQPGVTPQSAMIGQPQITNLQGMGMMNQMQQPQTFGTGMGGEGFSASSQFQQQQQQQVNAGAFNQFNNQQMTVVQSPQPGTMQNIQQGNVNQMMSPRRNPHQQQAQGQFQLGMASPSGPRLPNPQQQVIMMGQGQMPGWNVQNVQMYGQQQQQQQQGQTQYLSHHDYAIPSSNSSTNFQNQIVAGNQATLVQQGVNTQQQNRMPVRQAVFANSRMQFGQQPSMANVNSDQIIMHQQKQQQQQQQFMQSQQQPQQHNTVQMQQYRFPNATQVQQQGMADASQQNMVRFSQTSPSQSSVQHRLPFTSMSQPRQNVPMLSPRPAPPPPSPSGSQGVLSPTGSTSVSQTNFVQNMGMSSGKSGNLFNQGASMNVVSDQKTFNIQGQVNPMMSPPQGANPNLSQIASPNSNSCSAVNVNTSANVNNLSNTNITGGQTNQVSPTFKVLSSNMNSPPHDVAQEIQNINQQIQQLYNLPQSQDTQQKMLDLQERLRLVKSQQHMTSQQRQPQMITSQSTMTQQVVPQPSQQQVLSQQNVVEQAAAPVSIQNVNMNLQQQNVAMQQSGPVQQIRFPVPPQNVGLSQQNPGTTQPGMIRHATGAVQQPGAAGQQSVAFKINAQPGQRLQLVRGPAQPGGGPQKIFIIQHQQVANPAVATQQQQQQPSVQAAVTGQPVSSSQQLLKTVPQSQQVIINSSLSSGGTTQLPQGQMVQGQTQVVQNVTVVRPQNTLPVPVQVQIPVVQNVASPQSVQNSPAQQQVIQSSHVQIVREAEQDGNSNSNVSQQQEKANKIIAEAIAKAQRTGAGSSMGRVLSPPELPSTLADVDNPDGVQEEKPAKPKRKRKPRSDGKEKTPRRRRKDKVKVEPIEATDEATNVDVETTGIESLEEGEVKEKKGKKKREFGDKKKGEKLPAKFLAKKRKKPPATFLKSRKRRRRGSSDGSDVEIKITPPPSPENEELKRRSGRHTKRKKYMDELDLNLSDEDTVDAPEETSRGGVVKPAQVFVDNPKEEDAVVVEKILGSRMRTKDADVSNDEDEEDDVEEYYVKYKNFSYLHCEWKTEKELMKDKRIAGKIRRYKLKKAQMNNYFSTVDDDELFNPEYVEVDRVLEESITEDPSSGEDVTHYLVKWRGLAYEDSTWELQQDVDPEKVKVFKKFRELPPPEDRERVKRPSSGSQWEALTKSHKYKGNNTLREYQLEGVNWLTFSWYKRQNCILADEMGLGKTIQSIAFLHEIFNYGIKGPFLVIVPLSTIGNWMREFDLWTDMNVIVYHGTSPSRFMLQEYEMYYKSKFGHKISSYYKFQVLITTYEVIISDLEVLRDIDWRCVIIDEAHRLKNKNCRLMEGLRFFDFEHKVLLSGTPLQNNVEELFSLLNFLEPSQFHSSEDFLNEFGTLKTEDQVDKLKAILKPMMLRRLKEDVEKNLAAKEETIIEVELTNIQKKYYRAILERNFSFLHKGTQSSSNVPNLMNTMMELRKCCNHPYLINGAEENILSEMKTKQQAFEPDPVVQAMIQASGKFVLLDKLLPKLKQNGHKVLVFSQMIRVLDILEDYLVHKRYLYERIDGRITGNLRQEAIDRFSKPDSDRFVFLLCTRAGGLGINLTAADTVIIYDSDWNPQNDLQAQARCHRIGQVRMVKVYRLITRNSYEREMFDRASMKLGLDKAVLQSMGGEKINPQAQMTKREIEELLRKGAYGALMEDDSAGDAFCEEDIDQILQRRTQVIQIESEGKGSTFAKASFSITSNRDDIDINDPEFWQKWAKKADVDVDAGGDKELIIEEPRVRKKTTRYGNDNGVVDISDLGSSSDTDTDSKGAATRGRRSKRKQDEDTDFENERHASKNRGPGYGRSELFKVEKGLLVYGWGRWSDIVSHANWKRHMEAKDVEKVSRAILIYSLQHYKGDERIKEFIWDLVSPSGDTILKNHSGLSAPVPRGRKGRKGKEVVKEEPKGKNFCTAEALAGLKIDPNIVLGDNGYKKHLHRHSNKVLLRVRTLYYLKQEVIGDAAEKIAKGVSVVHINIPLPAVDIDPPSAWWDDDADKSLLIGVYKHGYEKYNLMRQDPTLCFLLRCGPPDGAALAAEMKDDDDDDDKVDQSIVNDNDEEEDTVLSASDVTASKPTAESKSADPLEDDEEEKLPFPSISDLNTRLRRVITNYQRDYKKQQLKKEAQAKKIEKRERLDAIFRERETRRKETQQRWVRREETDFYRVVSTYGIEFDRHKGRYVWDKFRVMAKLDKKTDEQLTEYFISFYHMCLRVCRKIKEDAYPPTPLYVEAITEERANRCIARIDLLSKIREEIIVHPKFDERIDMCKSSYDLPEWWISGKHDRELLIGAAKHGLAKTDYFILNDPQFSFREYINSDAGSQKNSPANFKLFGKDLGKDRDASEMSETQDEEDTKPKEKLNIKEESDHATGETTEEEDNYPEIGEVKREINISDFIRKEVKKEPVTESDEADKMEVMNSDAALDLKVTVKEEVDKTELIKAEMDEDTEDTVNGGEDMTELLEKKEIKMEVKEEVKEKDEGEDADSEKTEIEEKDDASVIKDEEDEEVRRTFEKAERATPDLFKNLTDILATQWPKDRVVFHRLEHICYCVETGEWPFGKKMPNNHILGIDSGSATPSRTPTMTPMGDEESNALQEMMKSKAKLEKDFEVQLSEGEGLKLTFHKKAKGKHETLEAEKAARIQQILAQSVAASAASSDESRQDSNFSTSQVSGPLPWQPNSPFFFLSQTPDSMFMNGSPSSEADLLMNQSLIEQGLLYPGGRRRGRKRKAEKLAEIAMAEALARRQTARAIASYDSDSRVPVINLEDGSRLTGDGAPMKKDLDAWLDQHPGYVIDKVDDELEEGEVIPDYHERRRGRKPKVDPAFLDVDKLTGEENVSVINRLTGKKITGAKAPPLRYLGEWLEQNPMWDVDPKWSELVRAKGSLPKQLLPRVVTPNRRGRGRPSRDSPLSHSMLGTSDPHAAAALAASMEAMNAAQLMAAGIHKLPLPFGTLPGLGLGNPLLGLSGLGIPGLQGSSPLSKDSESKRKDLEDKEGSKGDNKSPHPSFPMLYNPLLYNPLFAAQSLGSFPLPTSLSSPIPGLSSKLINGHTHSDSEEEPKISRSRKASEQYDQDEAEDLSVKSEKKVVENVTQAHSSGIHKTETVLDDSEQPCDLSMKSKPKEEVKPKIIGSDKLSRIVDSLKDRVNKMDDKPVKVLSDKEKGVKKNKINSLLFSLSQENPSPESNKPSKERHPSLSESSKPSKERHPSLSESSKPSKERHPSLSESSKPSKERHPSLSESSKPSKERHPSLSESSKPSKERHPSLSESSKPSKDRPPSLSDKPIFISKDRHPSFSENPIFVSSERHSSSKLTSHSESSLTKKSSLMSSMSQTSSAGVKPSTKEPVPQIVQELLAAKQLKDAAKLQKEVELAAKQQRAIEALVAKQRQVEDALFLKKQASDAKLLKEKSISVEKPETFEPESEEES